MKAVIKNVRYCFLYFFLIITIGCTGKSTKQADVKTVSCDTLTGETSATVIEEKGYAIDSIGKGKEIDLDKIYEESEVVRAFPSLNNSQFMEFISKHFKYPDIDPVNGRGTVDLVSHSWKRSATLLHFVPLSTTLKPF